jgi:hypothetical protein
VVVKKSGSFFADCANSWEGNVANILAPIPLELICQDKIAVRSLCRRVHFSFICNALSIIGAFFWSRAFDAARGWITDYARRKRFGSQSIALLCDFDAYGKRIVRHRRTGDENQP